MTNPSRSQSSASITEDPNLDYAWIAQLISKRLANTSTIAAVESRDQYRFTQLKAALMATEHFSDHHLFCFDPWQGLARWNNSDFLWNPVQAQSSAYAPAASDANVPQLSELTLALRHMDRELKQQPSILLLRGLESERRNDSLAYAVRSWALDTRLLNQDSLVVLFTGNCASVLDELTKDQVIIVTPPLGNTDERQSVIQQTAKRLGMCTVDNCLRLVQSTAGLTLHQLSSTLIEAYHRDHGAGLKLETVQSLKDELIKRSQFVEVEEPSWGFEAVGGYQAVKSFIQKVVVKPLQEPTHAAEKGIELPRGVLLFGPPGTGKTLFAKALAKESGLPFINLKTENLFSMYLGESGHRFGEAIRLIEQMSPALVFIDEIDRFGQRNNGTDGASQETRRVFSQILEWLGDRNRRSLVLGTTNSLEDLDEALIARPGRLDYKIPFLYPSLEGRREILSIYMGLKPNGTIRRPPLAMSDKTLNSIIDELAASTPNLTGAELEQLIMRARRLAFCSDRPAMIEDDLRNALAGMRISREGRNQQKEHYLRQAEQFTDDNTFLAELRRENIE